MFERGARPRVLFVEDEEAIRDLVSFHLDIAGYECVTASDGKIALDIASEHSFDLMVLDLMLPTLDGVTLCQAVRRAGPNREVPVLMLSARREESDKIVGLESGADDYVTKPFSIREFLARINALMRRPRSTWRATAGANEDPVSALGVTIEPNKRRVTCVRIIGSRTPPEETNRDVVAQFQRLSEDADIPRGWRVSIYRAVPIRVHGRLVGLLGTVPKTTLEQYGPEVAAIGMGLLLVGTLFSSALIFGPVRSRLRELQLAVGRLGAGELTARAREEGRDEVSDLARAFNSMADELGKRAIALEASDRTRRQLIADVSHELMTPLTTVLGHLETLAMAEVQLDDEGRHRHVAIATREAQRLERLIGDLLDTARLEAGGGDLDIQRIATREVFDEVVAHHEVDCRARNIRFVCLVAPDAETLGADPFRLEQALENVTANAMRHTADGKVIELKAERSGRHIVLTVADSGEGIAPEHLPLIFHRFYKTASVKGIASRGSGLGLSIVKALVTRHGGQVSATSTLGVGTTIRLELPSQPDAASDERLARPA